MKRKRKTKPTWPLKPKNSHYSLYSHYTGLRLQGACFVSGLHELFLCRITLDHSKVKPSRGSPNGGVKIENKSGSHLGLFFLNANYAPWDFSVKGHEYFPCHITQTFGFFSSKLKIQFFFGGPLYHSIFTTVLAGSTFRFSSFSIAFESFFVCSCCWNQTQYYYVLLILLNHSLSLSLSLSLVILSFIILWQFWEKKMELGISDSKVVFVVVFGVLVLNCFTEFGTDAQTQTQTLAPDEGIYFPTH